MVSAKINEDPEADDEYVPVLDDPIRIGLEPVLMERRLGIFTELAIRLYSEDPQVFPLLFEAGYSVDNVLTKVSPVKSPKFCNLASPI
jgi:hypothetical protein